MKKATENLMVNSDSAVVNVTTDTSIITVATDTEVTSPAKPAEKEVKTKKTKGETKTEKKTSKKEKDKSVKVESAEEAKSKKLVVKNKKKVEAEKPAEEKKSLFPDKITVHGVEFRKLIPSKENLAKDHNPLLRSLFNNDEIVLLGFYIPKEFLAPKGKKGVSDYTISTGIISPPEFPQNIEFAVIDAVLYRNVNQYLTHSVYTEYPGVVDMKPLEKRTKDGYFVSTDKVPFEIYTANYDNADENFVEGEFINLYGEDK